MDSPLDKAYEAIETFRTPETELLCCTVRGLMHGYDAHWRSSGWHTLQVEQEFHLPIINPDSGRRSRTFTYAGKFDGVVGRDNGTFLLEHKPAGEDITNPNAPYYRRLEIDAQISAYVLANWQMGNKVDGTLYDIYRRPSIRPKHLSKTERTRIRVTGGYCGRKIGREAADLEIESPAMFEARLAYDACERPDFYFARKIIYRMDSQVLDFARELWQVADEARRCKADGHWYMNSAACMQFGWPCQFLGACSGHTGIDSDNWRNKERTHQELNTITGDGRDVLTHSSMSTFKLCRKKFFYLYELGLEKITEEESDALKFGTLIHEAFSAWWSAFTTAEGTNGKTIEESAVSG